MREHTEFGGVRLVIARDWCDITDDLEPGSPPTLARNDGVGVLQFSSATYKGGAAPTIGARELTEMLQEFACAQGFDPPKVVRAESGSMLTVSGDFVSKTEMIRAWYVTDAKNIAFITYVSQEPESARTREELRMADDMVRSIQA